MCLQEEKQRFPLKPTGFLRTVSRLVATTETAAPTQTKDHVIGAATDVESEKQEELKAAEEDRGGVSTSTTNSTSPNGFKSHPLHIVVWVHVLSLVVIAAFGWIDLFPVTGPIKTLSRHLSDTENTLMCHLNVAKDFGGAHARTKAGRREIPWNLEILTNFVPDSANFNETVQKIRSRRSLNSTDSTSLNSSTSNNNNETNLLNTNATHHSLELHFNYTTKHHVNKTPTPATSMGAAAAAAASARKHLNHNKFPSGSSVHHVPRTSTTPEQQASRKSDNAYTWKWFQGGIGATSSSSTSSSSYAPAGVDNNKVNQTLEDALNSLLGSSSSGSGDHSSRSSSQSSSSSSTAAKPIETGNCGRTQIYAVVLLGVYLLFAACLINFLIISESAVFTVCVVTGALPLIGVFWSLFEVSYDDSDRTVGLIWSPEVSGELICSLLGCPIVFLGIGLLCRANFSEQVMLLRDELATGKSHGGGSMLQLSYDNRNYYSTYLETGLSNVGEVDTNEIRHPDCHIATEKA